MLPCEGSYAPSVLLALLVYLFSIWIDLSVSLPSYFIFFHLFLWHALFCELFCISLCVLVYHFNKISHETVNRFN